MPDPDENREIADASFLFDEGHERPPPSDRTRPGAQPVEPPEPGPGPGGYDLAGQEATGAGPDPDPAAPVAPVPPPVERRPQDDQQPKAPKQITPSPVDPPWSRLGEWGPAVVRIAIVALVTCVLAYMMAASGSLGLSLMIAAIGFSTMVLLSYPIAVTLERPVRMTPEHALRDYYGALSHHLPQYRRMWLLLSSAGRSTPEFGTIGEFRSYWAGRLAALKGGKAGAMTPVSVRIEQFKSEKSAGQDAIEGTYTVSVFLRGREDEGPVHSARTTTSLSRGPDRMWYLDDGRLPRS